MGIKGIHQEIGGGERIALLKLAAQSLEQQGRPLRIAIDVAIWQFQNQAAQGGTNPEIRTLFYRLVRLLACPVEPIFVFDGPHKPAIKRNKQSSRGSSFANAQAKRLIRLFGCNTHDAPGEAEAECALLQQHGIVDMVLTEDVDALMFGCTKVLRKWSPESKRSTTPTHVSLLDAKKLELGAQGLDREGMVLVALMSGGDYNPDGLPGCGIKVALEAARAGFGKKLCRLKAADKEALQAWRNSLIHELRTNEKGYFKRRNQALRIPETFPDFKVLRYYTHPVVSPVESLGEIREKVHMKREIQIEELREFAREVFGWDYRVGALKFLKVLSHAVLVQKLQASGGQDPDGYIKAITATKNDVNHDSVPVVRLQHIPIDLVPIDLSKEEDENILQARGGLALNSDDDIEDADNIETSVSKALEKPYDPSRPLGVWVIEALAKNSELFAARKTVTSAKVRGAERRRANPPASKKSNESKTGMPAGALNKFVRATKPHTASAIDSKTATVADNIAASPTRKTTSRRLRIPSPLEPSKQPTSTSESPTRQTTNPWPLASSQVTPRTRSFADGKQQAIVITSSPACEAGSPPPSPSPPTKTSTFTFGQQSETMLATTVSSGSQERLKVKDSTRDILRARRAGSSQPSQTAKLKQTSIDMFARTSKIPSAFQPPLTKPPSVPPKRQPKSQPTFDDDFDSDSSSDLVPLSSLVSRASVSPKRQQESLPSSLNLTPSPIPARKKKLLIPRASAVGFFKEVEVDAEERDELMARETATLRRKGVRANVVRVSDVGFIDLTQDD
ncbi:DNA repair endonuclease rad2 [Fusarium longipes]|uniref:DNA repair endonuclease rad2 n=1 Tax=Fusarium longipes TaxID=694270 RepID=A0A395SUC9_9HYPO|nr:DNA repair endonuclease rad2 [Fusarium longipes]